MKIFELYDIANKKKKKKKKTKDELPSTCSQSSVSALYKEDWLTVDFFLGGGGGGFGMTKILSGTISASISNTCIRSFGYHSCKQTPSIAVVQINQSKRK